MKYFSVCTGVGGFEYGIEQATDRKWECIGYSEIDKYAIQCYEQHFKGKRNYGDIHKIKPEELPDFDLLCGGFPCQAFSIAGKRMGFEDTRGTVFFSIAKIISIKKPRYVLLENVKGLLNHNKGRTFATILSTPDELGYNAEWELLNSKNFGVPQNRERVFIIGYLRGKPSRQIFPLGRNLQKDNETNLIGIIKNRSQGQRVYSAEGIATSIASQAGGLGAKTGLYAIPVLTPDRIKKRQNGRRFKENGDPSFALTGQDVHGDAMDIPVIHSLQPRMGKGQGGKGHLQKNDGSTYCVDTAAGQPVQLHKTIRRLTPLECERLQGFPDNWTAMLSDTQRYKTMGNAVTTKVVQAVIEKLILNNSNLD